ncbi:MAG: hypothetical protein K2Z81_26970, partial [Cyanobacteria bacterium]|nr:hypothetical protein [Cyanobacteriota bacterium]
MAGLFGQGMVFSDKISIGSIEINGGDSSLSNIGLSTTVGDVQVGSINSNGACTVVTSAANVNIASVVSNNANGAGGTLSVESYVFAAPTDSTTPLNLGGGGANSIGSVSLNGASGGSLYLNNHGTGGVNVGNVAITASTGNGGNLVVSADSDVILSGSSYSVNGGTSGAGGQVLFSGVKSVQGGNVNISATGGLDGGTLSMTGSNIQFSNLVADTSGNGTGIGGAVAIGSTGTTITAQSMTFTNNGGGVALVQLTGSVHVDNLTVTSTSGVTPGRNAGNINLILADGVHGALNLNASGSVDGIGGIINIVSQGNLNLLSGQANIVSRSGTQSGNGGFVHLFADGAATIDASTIDVTPRGADGNGGTITVETGLNPNSASGALTVSGTLNADAVGNGNGGSISLVVHNTNTSVGNLTIGNGSGFNLSAQSGQSSGNGGTVTVSTGGDLVVNGSGIAVTTRGINGNGGTINLTAGAFGGNRTLTVQGNLLANSVGTGNGGNINMLGQQLTVSNGALVSASASGSGKGGNVTMSATGTAADLAIGFGTQVLATSNSGTGGSIILNASRDLNVSGATVNASSSSGTGGQLALSAGKSMAGVLTLDGSLLANGGSAGGSINLVQNSALAMQLGKAGGQVGASISATGGSGGSLSLSSGGSNDLNVLVEQTVNLKGANLGSLGTVNASSSGKVSVTANAAFSGSFNGSANEYSVTANGGNSNLGVKSVSTTNGDASFKATAADGTLAFASGASLQASGGSIEIGAPTMEFLGNATVSMD